MTTPILVYDKSLLNLAWDGDGLSMTGLVVESDAANVHTRVSLRIC